MERSKMDFGAGIFLILAVLGLAFISLRTVNTNFLRTEPTYSVKVSFENIGALRTGSPVKSSGILVGFVERLDLDPTTYEAVAILAIEDRYLFPSDSSFSVVSTNLLGDQYINVEAGGADDNIEDGSEMLGNSAIILEDLISKFLFEKAEEG